MNLSKTSRPKATLIIVIQSTNIRFWDSPPILNEMNPEFNFQLPTADVKEPCFALEYANSCCKLTISTHRHVRNG